MDEGLRLALRVIFLVLHIIFAGMAITQVPVALVLGRMIRGAQGKPHEITLMGAFGQVVGFLGQVGGVGLLITGLLLIGMDRLGLLGLGGSNTPLWLFVKQVVYIVILVIVIVLLTPRANKTRDVLMSAARSGQPVTEAMRASFHDNERISWVIDLLVLVNIVLAVWKPT